ncbi:MAG: phytoene desaturase family protein [Dehalococcoidia bacterium]
MNSDVVIIGGGVSGLAAGALLAKAGRRVTVLEKGNQAGGRAYTYEDRGFTLNYGPHAVYRPQSGVLGDVLRRLGVLDFSYGYAQPTRSYWADGDRFGAVGARPHEALLTPLFPLTSRLRLPLLMAAIRFAKPDALGDQTYGDWVDAHISDARLRRFAVALGTVNTYTRPSRALSARFLLGHLQRNLFAKDYVGYMSGGWRTMYDAFIGVLRANGGALVTGAHVRRLEIGGGRAIAAITPDARYEAASFISTLPPQDAPSIAEDGSPLAEEIARSSRVEDVRALCMDLGFSHRLRTDLSYIFDIERDLYYSLHSEVTPDLAPAGAQLMHAMAYLAPEEADDERLLAARRAALEAGLDRWFPGWRDALVVERTLPCVRVTSLRQTPAQRAMRVPLRSSAAPNLYFAGDARDIEGNLTEICLKSALEAAEAAESDAPAQRSAPVTAVP